MKIIFVKFKTQILLPDGNQSKSLSTERRPGYHEDRLDPYDMQVVEEMPGLFVLRLTHVKLGKTRRVPWHEIESYDLPEEPQAKIGEGKAGPGRGHTGKMKPEVNV